jgi:hypothetical protein
VKKSSFSRPLGYSSQFSLFRIESQAFFAVKKGISFKATKGYHAI